ncbi:MAG: threonine--tRNA ligase [Vampirovibrionales bacterium]|nr:threonine--tRNA ligase [Vampirovibrionales bacterium]
MMPQSLAPQLEALTWTPVDKAEFSKLPKAEQLRRIRHSSAHVLASAIQTLRPDVQLAIGPATATGFFYDMKFPGEPLSETELDAIEKTMQAVAGRSAAFEIAELAKPEAIKLFEALDQPHKVEILNRIPAETVTLYRHQTPDKSYFIDLCAGPHVPHTGLCRAAKPLSLSAAHWHGELTPSLTRVAGTAWANEKDLAKYLEFLSASKARDHRTLGPQLDLFTFHPWAMAPMWHPNGFTLRQTLAAFWREMTEDAGYVEIFNPLLYRKALFETSGHWDHFRHNMFVFKNDHEACEHIEGKKEPEKESEGEADILALKPMNCPDTMLYFKSSLRSYRDLPMRVAEGQILHRNEPGGSIHGLMRTRSFIQDDAHIFLTGEQVETEVKSLLDMIDATYKAFDLEYSLKLSTRPENSMGELAVWEQAEAGLKSALEAAGFTPEDATTRDAPASEAAESVSRYYSIDPGEGAFYGPKIDVFVLDSLGRQWQCGTVQLDFQLPARFELKYADADGSLKQPIVVHRAVFGSFERFIGILIEHFGGLFPTWLAPVQAAVLPIGETHLEYAKTVKATLKKARIRTVLMDENTINYRVRQAETQKIPHIIVVGGREADEQSVTVRKARGGGKQQVFALSDFLAHMQDLVTNRTLDVEIERFDALFRAPAEAVMQDDEAY